MSQVDYDAAQNILEELHTTIVRLRSEGKAPSVPSNLLQEFKNVFSSATAAYRETLLGCSTARLVDDSVNIRKPYMGQGADAFNGRTLDERVVNPFLHSKEIPSSKGPYLSVFRRNVMFNADTRKGLKDKAGYDAFDKLLSYLEKTNDADRLRSFALYLPWEFAELRERSKITIARLHRVSLSQYADLIDHLVSTPSGGRIPVLLVLATFRTIKEQFALDWEIDFQEINVADKASGVAGDITIKQAGKVLMSAEITERSIEASRVQSTFMTKIAPLGIEDYLFLVDLGKVMPEARAQANNYFAQGHEVNFLDFKNWITTTLATLGSNGRKRFNVELTNLLQQPNLPSSIKVAWNQAVANLTKAN